MSDARAEVVVCDKDGFPHDRDDHVELDLTVPEKCRRPRFVHSADVCPDPYCRICKDETGEVRHGWD